MLSAVNKNLVKKSGYTLNKILSRQFSSLIADSELFKTEIEDSNNQKWFAVSNPATLETLGYCPEHGVEELRESINVAHATFWNKGWKSWTPQARSQALNKFYDLMVKNEEDLAKLCTMENGKSLTESKAEVKYAASFLQWFASEAVRTYGDVIPSPSPAHRLLTLRQPVGVVGIITPWNFPLAMITRKLGPALAAGCTAVIKPASETPLCAIALQKLAIEAGFPEGSINIVTTDKSVKEIGKEMCGNKKLSKISFTGSTAVGRLLMSEAGNTVKRVSMELGGNAPFIVFEDADIDNAVDSAMATKFRNAGQTCISANRFIVHSKIHDQFVERLAMKMEQTLKVGNGMDEGVNVGPLINQKGLEKVLKHIKNAKSNGAKLIIGGNRIGDEGTFVEPTLFTNISKSMDIHCEETFGPIVGVFKFDDELEAIQLANDTEFGLASYFFSKDIDRIWRVAEQLQSGMVGINTGTLGFASTPFGGIKQSGVGVEGSKYGIDEYLSKKLLSMGVNSNL